MKTVGFFYCLVQPATTTGYKNYQQLIPTAQHHLNQAWLCNSNLSSSAARLKHEIKAVSTQQGKKTEWSAEWSNTGTKKKWKWPRNCCQFQSTATSVLKCQDVCLFLLYLLCLSVRFTTNQLEASLDVIILCC